MSTTNDSNAAERERGGQSGGNAAPPRPNDEGRPSPTPDTTPANAGLRFEDDRTENGGDGALSSDR